MSTPSKSTANLATPEKSKHFSTKLNLTTFKPDTVKVYTNSYGYRVIMTKVVENKSSSEYLKEEREEEMSKRFSYPINNGKAEMKNDILMISFDKRDPNEPMTLEIKEDKMLEIKHLKKDEKFEEMEEETKKPAEEVKEEPEHDVEEKNKSTVKIETVEKSSNKIETTEAETSPKQETPATSTTPATKEDKGDKKPPKESTISSPKKEKKTSDEKQ